MDPALWELLRAEAGAGDDREIEAIIRLARPGTEIPDVRIVARFGPIATCRIRPRDVIAVRSRSDVLSLKAPRGLSPGLDPGPAPANPPVPARLSIQPTDLRRSPAITLTGAGVVVASVDWGMDLDSVALRWPGDPQAAGPGRIPGGTRFLSFWDQRDQATGPHPEPYGYGAVHDRAEIDSALLDPRPYQRLGYHPAVADPGGTGSHGMHVMDIAAGNGEAEGPSGVAPDADLVFVHLADRNTGGLGSFGDSVRLLEAVDFISRTAGAQPCVINISAGRICGPKDGTTLVERALDHFLATTAARFVVNSVGNYYRWRTHACGTIEAGQEYSFTFISDPADTTANELEIWYDGDDEFAVRIDPPGYTAGRPVCLGERSDLLVGRQAIGRVYHRRHDPNNGDNHIAAFLDPGGLAGNWTVTLEGRRVSSGRFHAWIERDDSCPGCQARFAPDDSNPVTTIGTIASSHLPLVVGAYDGHDPARPAAPFSSAGPTRDGRCGKPDLVAPGVDVLAARSAPLTASRNPGLLTRKSGTSMAAPVVTGAVALCLQAAGSRLTAPQIRDLVLGSCDPGPDADPGCRFGCGYLNIPRLVEDLHRSLNPAVGPPAAKETTMNTDDDLMLLSAAPAIAYREYLYRPGGDFARWISDRFDVVGGPGQPIGQAPQEGDVLLEVTLGRMGPGRCIALQAGELELLTAPPRLAHGRLLLRPRLRAEMSDPLPVEPAEADGTEVDRLIDQGLPENQITDTTFYLRHPARAGTTLVPGTTMARLWQTIRDNEVRPRLRQRLAVSPTDPLQLAVFLSQYENDDRVPAEYTARFLTATPLLSMGRTLRDQVLANWLRGGRPLSTAGLYRMALEIAGNAGTAALLCHNVSKAFVREGQAITWRRTSTKGEYTDGQNTYTARVVNPAGRLRYSRDGKQETTSIFFLLFSATEFGTVDPGDWYHYFVTASVTALASTGRLHPASGRREDTETVAEDRGGRVGATAYEMVLADRLADLEQQMTDPRLAPVPGYRGWVIANVLSFLEGGGYGADYATDQSDVLRESKAHLQGATFGLRIIGGSPGPGWSWHVPVAGSLSTADLALGFSLKEKTANIWGPSGQSVSEESDATGPANGEPDSSEGSDQGWRLWTDLIQHRAPPQVVADLARRGISIPPLRDASGAINLDYYGVRISKLPSLNGRQLTPAQLLAHIRRNLNIFVDNNNSTFPPLDNSIDGTRWQSDDPLGAVINIQIHYLRSFNPLNLFIDQGLVVCSRSEPNLWVFTTAHGGPARYHPVTGNRMWGIRPDGDGWILFVQGADRTTQAIDRGFNVVNSVWRGADELWQSFQAKTCSFINTHQGSAIVVPPQSRRWPWADIEGQLPSASAEETPPRAETQSAEQPPEQTVPPQHTSADGVRMISGFEGFCANLYDDGSPHCGRGHGHCTIGYGHLVHHGPCDGRESEQPFLAGISRDQGRQLLAADLTRSENRVHTMVTAALTQQQFDALVSFDFNTGRLNTLVHDLNSAQSGHIPALMNQFVHAHVDGQVVVLPGLVTRRAAEGTLFATGQYPR
ncbi:MAG: hypothetical protein QOJ73_3288 [Streptosporangiaceae bacterium]|nr:hypothetical protein [Streptosporangiaceae bacterium]